MACGVICAIDGGYLVPAMMVGEEMAWWRHSLHRRHRWRCACGTVNDPFHRVCVGCDKPRVENNDNNDNNDYNDDIPMINGGVRWKCELHLSPSLLLRVVHHLKKTETINVRMSSTAAQCVWKMSTFVLVQRAYDVMLLLDAAMQRRDKVELMIKKALKAVTSQYMDGIEWRVVCVRCGEAYACGAGGCLCANDALKTSCSHCWSPVLDGDSVRCGAGHVMCGSCFSSWINTGSFKKAGSCTIGIDRPALLCNDESGAHRCGAELIQPFVAMTPFQKHRVLKLGFGLDFSDDKANWTVADYVKLFALELNDGRIDALADVQNEKLFEAIVAALRNNATLNDVGKAALLNAVLQHHATRIVGRCVMLLCPHCQTPGQQKIQGLCGASECNNCQAWFCAWCAVSHGVGKIANELGGQITCAHYTGDEAKSVRNRIVRLTRIYLERFNTNNNDDNDAEIDLPALLKCCEVEALNVGCDQSAIEALRAAFEK
jgi:hypothetical protein